MSSYVTTASLTLGAAMQAEAMNPKVHFPEFIVGGQTAKRGEFKFYAAYESKAGDARCGASLVANDWALTAAHCNSEPPQSPSNFRVRVSAFDAKKVDPETEEVRVLKTIISYPEWDPATISFDYGLLQFAKPVDTVTPISLFNADVFAEDPKPLTLVGLGRDKGGPDPSVAAQLQVTNMEFVSDKACQREWGSLFYANSMICANFPTASACHGDSGGPLFFEENGMPKQIGVVSWGNPSCSVGSANVYGRLIPQVLEYIELTIAGGSVL